jgi:hypothetical protein
VSAKTELEYFDGLDNRREVMILLSRLGSDRRRARFLSDLIPASLKGFAGCPLKVQGICDPIRAYFLLVGLCNELGVPISEATLRLEATIKRYEGRESP